MLEIVTYGDPVLREKCTPVEKFDDGLRILVKGMFEALEDAQGVGLAGPQVGVAKRLFVIEIENEVKKAFINPQIIETSVEMVDREEGCLSLPDLWYHLQRPARVTVQAFDVHGKPFTVHADGLYARALQHEYDHLDGKLFIDHLDPAEEEKAIRKYEKRNHMKRNKRK